MSILSQALGTISDSWEGYFLNYLVPEDSENYNNPHKPPNNIDWKVHLKQGVYLESLKPVDLNFLWAYKQFNLPVDPETELSENALDAELLDKPFPIVIIQYDYGKFDVLAPEKQDLIFSSLYRESYSESIQLKPYKILHNHLTSQVAKDKFIQYRRTLAESYIKQRAREIDKVTAQIFAAQGDAIATGLGLKQLDLTGGIKSFFEEFSLEMYQFINSGSLKINDAIQSVLDNGEPGRNAWLKENILVGQNQDGLELQVAGEIIKLLFQQSTLPINQQQITDLINKDLNGD